MRSVFMRQYVLMAVNPDDIEDLPDVDDNGDVVVDENVDFEGNIVPLGTNGLEALDGDETEYITGDHIE